MDDGAPTREADNSGNNNDIKRDSPVAGSSRGDIRGQVIYVRSEYGCEPCAGAAEFSGLDQIAVAGSGRTTGLSDTSSYNNSSKYSDDDEAATHTKAFCWGLCCVQGCIWGIIGMIYFFVFLPSGFLLIVYGNNKKLVWATATGSVLLVMATVGVPCLCVCIKWQRRKQRERREKYRVQRHKRAVAETYVNPVDAIPADADVMDSELIT